MVINEKQNVIEHLKMIQGVIDRMGRNSFQLKAWSAALATGWLAFVARSGGIEQIKQGGKGYIEPWYLILAPFLILFALDGYYLWRERLFRDLYNEVRIRIETDFSMKTRDMSLWQSVLGYLGACFPTRSKIFSSTFLFHLCIVGLLYLVLMEQTNANRAQGVL